jgi:uncharacterized peroxidase-related enzyme
MPHLPYPSDSDIHPEARAVLDAFQKAYGRPSHIFRALSWNARFVQAASEAWHGLVVEPTRLDRWVREACVVITCSTQQTEYCVQGHSHALRREGRHLSENQVKAIQNRTFEGFAEPQLSIFRFAHKAAANAKSLTEEDYTGLRRHGLDNETILEILGVLWVNTAMNMIVDALDVRRDDVMVKELDTV